MKGKKVRALENRQWFSSHIGAMTHRDGETYHESIDYVQFDHKDYTNHQSEKYEFDHLNFRQLVEAELRKRGYKPKK